MSQEWPQGPEGGPFGTRPGQPAGVPRAHQNGSVFGGQYTPPPGQPGQPAEYGPPQQSEYRAWATVAYLTPFVVSFLGPLIIYLIKKNESPFVRHHAAQALNMIITVTIYATALIGLGVVSALAGHSAGLVLAFLLWIMLGCVYLVYLIIATVAANKGDGCPAGCASAWCAEPGPAVAGTIHTSY